MGEYCFRHPDTLDYAEIWKTERHLGTRQKKSKRALLSFSNHKETHWALECAVRLLVERRDSACACNGSMSLECS